MTINVTLVLKSIIKVQYEITWIIHEIIIPIQKDFEEAQALHEIVLQQALAQNKSIVDNGELFKGVIERIKKHAEENANDSEKDILGESGKALLK